MTHISISKEDYHCFRLLLVACSAPSHYLSQCRNMADLAVHISWDILHMALNTLRPRQNGHHFPDDIFKWIFLNENVGILIKISLKFLPKVPTDNKPALVQIMAWRHPGDKTLSEFCHSSSMHICVTQPQCVNPSGAPFTDTVQL